VRLRKSLFTEYWGDGIKTEKNEIIKNKKNGKRLTLKRRSTTTDAGTVTYSL